MTLKEWNPVSSTLLYHRAIDKRAASFIVFLEKIMRSEWRNTYAVFMSGYASKSISALCSCLSAHLSADLNSRYRERKSNSLRVSPLGYRCGAYSRPANLASSSIRCKTSMTSSDLVPATTATKEQFHVWASRFVMNVYNSPFDSDDSSIASREPEFSGKSSHSRLL